MARKKIVLEPHLKSWDEVDTALKQVAECERVLANLNTDMNDALDAIKKQYAEMAKPVNDKIKHLDTDICRFVTDHRAEIPGKTMVLNFGKTGFRITSKLKYKRKAADVVAALERLKLSDCIKTTKKVIADTLKKKPVDVLEAVGAYLEKKDEFWYETTKEELQAPSD